MLKIEMLVGQSRLDFPTFENWLLQTGKLLNEFWQCDEFNPFNDGELASVSVLCSAAARAGYSPVAESRVRRNGSESGGCRADLWFNVDDLSSAFEFKHWRNWRGGADDLKKTMNYSIAGAETFPDGFADRFYGGVIAPVGLADLAVLQPYVASCDLAFAVRGPAPTTFIMFNEILR